jgi:hypothetical protein
VSSLDKIRKAPDVDTAIEEAIAARRGSMDPKEMFGGPRDWVDQALPTVAFVSSNLVWGLDVAIRAALGTVVVLVLVRLVKRETLRHAFSGVFGVALAAVIAKKTGKDENYFLPGIITNLVYGFVFLVSALARKPLVGAIMRVLMEKPKAWHAHPRVRRAMTEATFGWAAVFLLRSAIMETLRRLDLTVLLGIAKIVMGYPLYIAALLLTMPYIKRRTRGVDEELPPEPVAEAEAGGGGEDAADDAEPGVEGGAADDLDGVGGERRVAAEQPRPQRRRRVAARPETDEQPQE